MTKLTYFPFSIIICSYLEQSRNSGSLWDPLYLVSWEPLDGHTGDLTGTFDTYYIHPCVVETLHARKRYSLDFQYSWIPSVMMQSAFSPAVPHAIMQRENQTGAYGTLVIYFMFSKPAVDVHFCSSFLFVYLNFTRKWNWRQMWTVWKETLHFLFV